MARSAAATQTGNQVEELEQTTRRLSLRIERLRGLAEKLREGTVRLRDSTSRLRSHTRRHWHEPT
jgi:ATP-dependent exoDNAse (exonuclease V) alpha subunit